MKISIERLDAVCMDMETKYNEFKGIEDELDWGNLILIKQFFNSRNMKLLKKVIDDTIDDYDMDKLDEINMLTRIKEILP